MKNKLKKPSLLPVNLIVALFAYNTNVLAQTSKPPLNATKNKNVSGWMEEKWDGPELKFYNLRKNIEGQIKKGVPVESIIEKYDNPQRWMDAELVFGYAVASYERARKENFSASAMKPAPNTKQKIHPSALMRLQRLNDLKGSPRTAEYARIRYLWECQYQGYGPLYPVAKRLVTRFPNDFEVKWWAFQSGIFGRGKNYKPDHDLLMRWANDLEKRQPNYPGIGILKPMVYYSRWGYTRTEVDEKRAITGFENFLKNAPSNDPHRDYATMRLRMIQTRKKVWANQKSKSRP